MVLRQKVLNDGDVPYATVEVQGAMKLYHRQIFVMHDAAILSKSSSVGQSRVWYLRRRV